MIEVKKNGTNVHIRRTGTKAGVSMSYQDYEAFTSAILQRMAQLPDLTQDEWMPFGVDQVEATEGETASE